MVLSGRKAIMSEVSVASAVSMAQCPWLTKDAGVKDATKLVELCITQEADWKTACAESNIGYARGWLIVRWAQITLTSPELFVKIEASSDKATMIHRVGEAVKVLVEAKCSWGECMVRLGQSEGMCRQGFKLVVGINDRGHRIGKGGRFVAGRPDLYTDNRKKQGAWIPATQEEHPAPSQVSVSALINFVTPEPVAKAKPVAKVVAKKA